MSAALHKQIDRFAEADLDGETVLMNRDTGNFFALKASAAVIWRLIDGTRDRAAIAAALRARFEGAPHQLEAELDAFLDQLREAGFVA